MKDSMIWLIIGTLGLGGLIFLISKKEEVPPEEKAYVNINSILRANIYINDTYIGITNSSYEINPGTYKLKLTKSGYYDYIESFTIVKGEIKTFNIVLEKTPVAEKTTINVNSFPEGAHILLNNLYYGNTNASFEIDPGIYTLRLTLDGYFDYTGEFTIKEGEIMTFNVVLDEIPMKSTINVNSSPTGAKIYLNNVYVGNTDRSYVIDPGEYILELILNGYEKYAEVFSVVEGETRDFNILLTKG